MSGVATSPVPLDYGAV